MWKEYSMYRDRQLGWATVVGTALVLVLAIASPASAKKFQMSGTWMMRKGQTFIPLQFASPATPMVHVSMGNWTSATPPQAAQLVIGLGGVDASVVAGPDPLKIPKHRFVSNHMATLPLIGTMLVQITSMFQVDAPYNTANLAVGAGPGNLTWCPSNPACAPGGSPPGGTGNNGRVIYSEDGVQYGGTMQMGLANGGLVTVKAIGPGVVGHVKFGGSGPTLRNLAVGGPQMGTNTPATEFVKLAAGVITAPIGGIPASGMLVTMPGPVVGAFPSIPTPNGALTGQFTTNFAFGHTTGDVIVQQVTGTGGDDFFAVDGSDMRTAGGGGNINTVAGGLARRNTLGGDTFYAQFDKIFMTLGPAVPSMSPAGFAAAGALILLGVGYAMRRRIG
jgi:hypothetical protein